MQIGVQVPRSFTYLLCVHHLLSAKVAWYKASSQSRSFVPDGSKWLDIAEGIPCRLQSMLPPHRWIALYEQHAHDLEPDESEFVKMNALLSSLKKLKVDRPLHSPINLENFRNPIMGRSYNAVTDDPASQERVLRFSKFVCMLRLQVFGGSFFLCDPFSLKAQHIACHSEGFAQICATITGSSPDGAAASKQTAISAIENMIDNSLHSLLMSKLMGSRGAASLFPKLFCPCICRSESDDKTGAKNDVRAKTRGSRKKSFFMEGRCWIGFGEGRLVLQAEGLDDDKYAIRTRSTEGLAGAFDGKFWSVKPEEVRFGLCELAPVRAP